MKGKAKEDGLKLRETLILGDLNMRLSKSVRRNLEYQDDEASDSEHENDDDIVWNDEASKGTYTKNEMDIVRTWLKDGMRIVNGRAPYDEWESTRGFSILDYVLSDRIEKITKIERNNVEEGCSDHQLFIIKSKPSDTWDSLGKSRASNDSNEELSIAQVDLSAWEEADTNRYNDHHHELFSKRAWDVTAVKQNCNERQRRTRS